MDRLFLLDAYALIYRSYYAFLKNPRINSKGLNTSAIMGFVNTLNEVITKEQPTSADSQKFRSRDRGNSACSHRTGAAAHGVAGARRCGR